MYDTIIIGNDLSSLIAAVILSKHGQKTVLLSENDHSQIFSESQYTFNYDPFPMTGFGLTQTCSRLFADIQIPLTELPGLHLLNPGLQIILPDHRIDCFLERDALLNDMEREFSVHSDDIRKFYTSVLKMSDLFHQWMSENPQMYPKTYKDFLWILKSMPIFIRESISISNKFRSFKKNPTLCRLFEAEIAVLSNFHEETGKLSMLSKYILSLPMRGIYYNKGGNEFLLSSIRSHFENSGGRIIKNCSAIKTRVNKEIDVDCEVIDTLSSIRGKYLITSTKCESFKLLIQNNRKLTRLNRKLKHSKAAYYPFTLHIGVLEKGIPGEMGHYVVIVCDKTRPVMDNNLVFMEISASGDTERAPSGKRALCATVFLQESPCILKDEDLKSTSAIIFKSIDTCLPFLSENIDYFNIDKSIELSRRCQKVINQKYRMRSDPFLGMSKTSNKTPVHNVFMTGGMLMAGLGYEGEIVSGMNAANAVLEQEGK